MATYSEEHSTDSEGIRRRKAETEFWRTTSAVGRSDPIEFAPSPQLRASDQDENKEWQKETRESGQVSSKEEQAEEVYAELSQNGRTRQRVEKTGSSGEYRRPDSERERYQGRNEFNQEPRRTMSLNHVGSRGGNRGRHRGGTFNTWRAPFHHSAR